MSKPFRHYFKPSLITFRTIHCDIKNPTMFTTAGKENYKYTKGKVPFRFYIVPNLKASCPLSLSTGYKISNYLL